MTSTALPVSLQDAESIGAYTGVRASMTNPINRRRREWVGIAVPYGSVTAANLLFVTDRGLRLRAVRSEDIAKHSTIYHVFAPFAEHQVIEGEFVAPRREPDALPFKFHPWATDDVIKLIPVMELHMLDGTIHTSDFPFLVFEELVNSPVMKRVHLKTKVGTSGFVVEAWFTFYSNSPVADVQVAFIWSDRSNPIHDFRIKGLFFKTGEPVAFDFALRNGSSQPTLIGNQWVSLICAELGFIDGSGLPLMGRMVCLPDRGTLPDYDPDTYSDTDPAAQVAQDFETIIAAAFAPVLGVCAPNTWQGKFLANRNLGMIGRPQEHIEAMADATLTSFMTQTLMQPSTFYGNRLIGIGKQPGQTGDQEDFGAQRGWMATIAGDPRWLLYASYSLVADFFRGFMHYEADGQRLDPAQHPNWVTWSGYTHFNVSQSPDRLGKGAAPWGARSSTGYEGYDDEHRSQNNLATLYALTGNPLIGYIIEQLSTSDIKNVRYARNFGTGAPRAVGRTMHCWANFMLLFPEGHFARQRYHTLIDNMAMQFMRDWMGDRFPGPVDIHADRTDQRMGITWNGQVLPAWSCWEHGLLVVGVYAAWKATRDPRWLDVARRVSRTIVRYATFKDTAGWTFIATCHWPKPSVPGANPTGVAEGEPLPAQYYNRSSTLVTPLNGDVSSWTQNAVLVFVETHDANDPDMPRAQEIVQAFMSQPSASPKQAEWEATVRRVPPIPNDFLNYAPVL